MSGTSSPTDSPSGDDSAHGATDSNGDAAFERIDWDAVDGSSRRLSPERIALVLGVAALGLVAVLHRRSGETYLFWRWSVGLADWLLLLSAVVLVAYAFVPLGLDPGAVRRLVRRLRARWLTVLSLAFLTAVFLIALYSLLSGFQPRLTLGSGSSGLDRFQPPPGFSVAHEHTQFDCVGHATEGNPFERVCYGSWEYLLGTDRWGYEMTDLLIVGARPVAYATLVTLGMIVPLATGVGLIAGYYGGLVDDLLMAYVDVQLSIPAILLYMIAFMFVGNSMFVLLGAFGLLSWGGIARIVRSETLQRREEGYVLSARAVGAPTPYVLRRHVFPNVTNSVLPAAFHLIALLVLTEAGLSFLGFHVTFQSWGMTVAEGLFHGPAVDVWWASTLPAVTLALTLLSCKLLGDGLRDVLDPRGGR